MEQSPALAVAEPMHALGWLTSSFDPIKHGTTVMKSGRVIAL
jgi:hypothetical protein